MKRVLAALLWIIGILVVLFAVLLFLFGGRAQAVTLLLAALIVLPPGRRLIARLARRAVPRWVFALALVLLGGLFVLVGQLTRPTSIYKSAAVRERVRQIYAEKMKGWPVPHESRYVETSRGRVHVIVSGPRSAPPMLLLHASGVAAWSWKFNAAALSAKHRTYAIDLIGDVGRSELKSMDHALKSGRDQAELYVEITRKLGVGRACVVGASEGGFIATNYALHAPERVSGLVLVGPMGYTGAIESAFRITLAQNFPTESMQRRTFEWAFSSDPKLGAELGEWFRLVMTGYNPAKVAPLPFSAEERRRLRVPTLFVLGKRDNLVGDPAAARALVSDIPAVRVEVLDTGHLVAAEKPDATNALILEHCHRDRT